LTAAASVRHADGVPSASHYALYVVAVLTLLAIPGPAVLYIVGQSIDGGRRAGIASVLGITTGTLVHVAAAVAGLSALIVSSRIAFDVVRYAGAAYLIVIGIRRLLSRDEGVEEVERAPRSLRSAYTRGVVVNVLNPKTALFVISFLPQFVDVSRGHVWLQILLLGLTMAVLGLLSDGTYAVVAGTVADRLRDSRRWRAVQRWVSGSLFVGLGAVAAAARR
jgi:threonine/homoserine/homoserine lactone efflux protein